MREVLQKRGVRNPRASSGTSSHEHARRLLFADVVEHHAVRNNRRAVDARTDGGPAISDANIRR
jgi:hypothetical protein